MLGKHSTTEPHLYPTYANLKYKTSNRLKDTHSPKKLIHERKVSGSERESNRTGKVLCRVKGVRCQGLGMLMLSATSLRGKTTQVLEVLTHLHPHKIAASL